MNEELIQKINTIDWSKYQTAYGPANQEFLPAGRSATKWPTSTPLLLAQLLSPNEEIAMDASHYLWCSICHQGAPSHAGLPATPLLMEIAILVSPKLQTEILCIFNDWLNTYTDFVASSGDPPTWAKETMLLLANNTPFFQKILDNAPPDSELAEFAKGIIEKASGAANG